MLWLTLRQLKSSKVPTRRQAAESLAEAPKVETFKALVEAFASDDDAEVRRHLIRALSKIEDERRIEPLLRALGDRDSQVQQTALAGLRHLRDDRLQPTLVPLLNNTDPGVRGGAANLLKVLGWQPEDRDDEIAFLIASGKIVKASMHGSAAIPSLEAVIQHGSYNQRVAAVEALGKISDRKVVKPLLAALKSGDPAVCVAAIGALGNSGGPDVFDSILPLMKHADSRVRTVAVETIGRIGAAKAVEPLKRVLADKDWDVRRAAAAALGKSKSPLAVEPLVSALRDEDADVRETAAISLGTLRDRRGISPLVKALADNTSSVRRVVAGALERIDGDWSNSKEAKAAIEELKRDLEGADSELRHTVVKLLNSLGVKTPKIEAAQPDDEPVSAPEKRRKLAVHLLTSLLGDLDRVLRQAAVESLGRIADPRSRADLENALRDADGGVRKSAMRALQEVVEGRVKA